MFFEPGKRKKPRVSLTTVTRELEPINYIKYDELLRYIGGEAVFDIECYINYFLCSFTFIDANKTICFELGELSPKLDIQNLSWIVYAFCIIGFNSRNYDAPLLSLALTGADNATLKQCSDDIIIGELNPKAIEQKYKIKILPKVNHIDIQEVAPLSESLKKYAARMHAKRLQDLPFSPHEALTREQMILVKDYNVNSDLPATIMLRQELDEAIKLRISLGTKYGIDLRSKSDAQLAEAIFVSELTKLNGRYPQRQEFNSEATFQYTAPKFIEFATPAMQNVLKRITEQTIGFHPTGKLKNELLEELNVKIGDREYAMGFGGLHSKESCRCLVSNDKVSYIDIDVKAFYPIFIINNNYYPEHLGPAFITIFKDFIILRFEAKKNKDKTTDASIKIVINGTFGKLKDIFSYLFSNKLLPHVTIGGQLTIFMLIEGLVLSGFNVASANTDGILVECPQGREAELSALVGGWERHCNLETEQVKIKSIHQRDINNYFAIKEDGEVKIKGCYAEKGSAGNSRLSKDPTSLICTDAVVAFLTVGKPIEQTIYECKDFTRFVVVRAAKGEGAHKNGIYLGKVVRWYYAKGETGEINYVKSGNKVANSEGGKPCMDLPPSMPNDIDYDKYIARAYEILYETGTLKRPGELF